MADFRSWRSYWDFERRVRHESRYIRTPDDQEFLAAVLATSRDRKVQMPAGKLFWRSQLGHDWRPEHQDGQYMGDVPCPYPPERMKPLDGKAKEGRANPKGIPYLYLATTRDTALSEVRPWIGSSISVAQFKTTKQLTIVDCSRLHAEGFVFHFEEPLPAEREKAVWAHIDRAFSEPVNPTDDAADYAPTQVIAELFKSDGADGIAYKSAFGQDGFNLVLFDITVAELLNCGLFEAKSLKFEFRETDNPYFVREKK